MFRHPKKTTEHKKTGGYNTFTIMNRFTDQTLAKHPEIKSGLYPKLLWSTKRLSVIEAVTLETLMFRLFNKIKKNSSILFISTDED